MNETPLPRHYRRNFWSLVLDFCFFGVGLAFVGPSTVIPSFLSALGASSAVIGLMSSLQTASWLLPQLFAARSLADKPYKKPYILRPVAVGRILLLLIAILVWATGAQPSWLIVLITVLFVAGFWVGDGLGSVAWFDLLSKLLPPRRRGRMTGTAQFLSGILSFLAGVGVEWVLSDRGLPFPDNYASLFLAGSVMMALSFGALLMVVEEKGVSAQANPSWRQFIPQLWAVLKRDRAFRRFIVARQLYGLSGLAMPFYMPYALNVLGLPAQVAGRYISIGVAGSILAAVALGWLNERHGSKRVVHVSIALGTAVPVAALLVPRLFAGSAWLAWGYGLVFFIMNASMSSMMPGWMTFVLELAPEVERPTYVGLFNTLNGVTTLFSTVGGLFLQWTGNNYNALFVLTLVGMLFAWPLPFWLPEPRHQHRP